MLVRYLVLCLLQPKEKRKGKKEIHKNNIETLKFYRKFSLIGSVCFRVVEELVVRHIVSHEANLIPGLSLHLGTRLMYSRIPNPGTAVCVFFIGCHLYRDAKAMDTLIYQTHSCWMRSMSD